MNGESNALEQENPDGVGWDEVAETRKQLFRFIVVGVSSVLFDGTVYFLLHRYFGVTAPVAKGASYLAGVVCVGFVLNKLWTFESAEKTVAEPLTYLIIYSITLFVNIGCNSLALYLLGHEQKIFAFLFATGVTTILNFLGIRFITFRRGIANRRETKLAN